jgi:autotransporter-associated beta strand protein
MSLSERVSKAALAGAVAVIGFGSTALAADRYWDLNGINSGATDDAGGVATGAWNTTASNWNLDPTGVAATGAYANGDSVFFSAGTNATGASTITVAASITPANITVEEGTIVHAGSNINLGAGTMTIRSGGRFSIATVLNVAQAAGGGGLLLDGGTIRQTNPGNSGSFWDPDGTIKLTANGGAVDYTSSGTGLVALYGSATLTSAVIVRDASVPSGTFVTLTKTGAHEFRYQGLGMPNTSYDKLVVNQGLFRLGFQGGVVTEKGFGAVPASFMQDQITLSNGGQIGTSFFAVDSVLHANRGITLGPGGGGVASHLTIPGKITGVGSLTNLTGGNALVLGGLNDYTGGFIQNSSSGTTVNAGALLAGPTSTLTVNNGPLNLNNAAQTVAGLSGSGGSVNLSTGHTLTVNQAGNSSFAGAVTGAGALVKSGVGTLTLTGTTSHTGGTTVDGGKLQVKRLHENNAVVINGSIDGNNVITGGTVQVLDSSPTLPSHPQGDPTFVSRPSSLTIANDAAPVQSRVYYGTLDLGNNDLIIDYTGTIDPDSPRASIEDMVRSGFNFGDWLGKGITSSVAGALLANNNYALGVAENAALPQPYGDGTEDPNTGGPKFNGQTVDRTTVLVKFTHRIDLDLDGLITSNDAALFNGNYSENDPAYWLIGDVDYDGIFTSNDAALFNGIYDESVASLPEPATLGLLAVAAVPLLRRRRA